LVARPRAGTVRGNSSRQEGITMKLRYKIVSAFFLLAGTALLALLIVLGHDSPCQPAPPLAAGATSMKAAVHRCYGSPDVIRIEDVEKPSPADEEVLVKIRAASVNALDWRSLRGEPTVMRLDGGLGSPQNVRLGVDYAGVVEAVGRNVTRFKPGDEVFGGTGRGTLAEYVSVRASGTIAVKPANLTFEEAAAIPVGALTALQALRDEGRLQPGQRVLINGASGAVGTFAVQIAKALGAEVTAVCSTKNVEMVRALGADRIVDYTREDFTQTDQRYDLILDNVGNRSVLAYRRVMPPKGILVIVGAGKGRWLGPFKGPIEALALSPFVSQKAGMFISSLLPKDLNVLADFAQSGKIKSIIDRRYGLQEVPDAIRYLEEGHARAKVVITLP
jgi:NADPH:quinone reductase-like Zn-dependent oxidoreductase